MDLFDIKEHVDTGKPVTYELKIKLSSERMKASVPQNMHMHFYDHFVKALASNIYEFKKNNYPSDDIYFSEGLGMLITYNKHIQQKYLQIVQVLNACSDEIIEKAKKSYSLDGTLMQKFANEYIAEHFQTYEEKAEKHIKEGRSKLKLFALYEDKMLDTYEIRIKLNDRDIIRASSTMIYTKIDESFNNVLVTYLYDYKKTNLPDKKINFYRNSGTLSTYDSETHEVFLKVLQELNNQSDNIINTLKQINQSTSNGDIEKLLKTYLAHHFLQQELKNNPNEDKETTQKKLKV